MNFLVESNDILATRNEGSDTPATNNRALICRDISLIVSIIHLILQWHETMENFPPNGDIIMIMFCMLGNEQIQSGIIPINDLENMFDLDSAPANVGAPAEQSAGIHVRFSNNTVTGGTNISTNAQADFHNNAQLLRYPHFI